MSLEVQNLFKRFGTHLALDNLSLKFPENNLSSLLGPSGCGKTTLLRILAGLEYPDSGSVFIKGEDQSRIKAEKRQVGFVFQHYALFKHLTVFENVAFGLRILKRSQRPSAKLLKEKVQEVLSLVQIDHLAQRYPDQLSGGQRQRVALARSLVVNPSILLLDEPFGALDAHVRRDLRKWLRRLHEEIALTTVLVTHDQEEALELSDQIFLLNEGRLEQAGSPEDLYQHPANPFVYRFLGSVNVFHGRLEDGNFKIRQDEEGPSNTTAFVRPHEFEVYLPENFPPKKPLDLVPGSKNAQGDIDAFPALVTRVLSQGALIALELRSLEKDKEWEVLIDPKRQEELKLKPGTEVLLSPTRFQTFLGENI